MDSLDKFQTKSFKHHCSLCGKELTRYSRVSIRATDPDHNYRNTYKPMINSYKFILCQEHFLEFKATMSKFIKENAKKPEVVSKEDETYTKIHADIDEIDKLLD